MPIPALLAAAIPLIGSAVAGAAGSALGNKLGGSSGGGGRSSSGGGGSFLGGTPSRTEQLPLRYPWQQQGMQQVLNRGLAGLE